MVASYDFGAGFVLWIVRALGASLYFWQGLHLALESRLLFLDSWFVIVKLALLKFVGKFYLQQPNISVKQMLFAWVVRLKDIFTLFAI